MPNEEHVVLLDDDGNACGTALKSRVHTEQTPLHLAFSCHVFDSDGRTLITRRALSKVTWPGVWTNSFCGHPLPGESLMDAIHRRAQDELGLRLTDLVSVLPDFRYRAVDASGIVENEICPVFRATAASEFAPAAEEVMDLVWAKPESLARAVMAAPFAFSPWLVSQIDESGGTAAWA